eukprot:c25245_g4_i2 orf=237-830(-)
MAIWSPPSSPSPAVANQQAFLPSSSLLPPRTSLSAHQSPAATQLRPTLTTESRRARCPTLRVTALHTCPPDTLNAAAARTLYEVLQVSQTATQAEIKASYRRLARVYHPDVCTSAADKEDSTKLFLQIHAAYSALSDEQSRVKYDLQLSAQALRVCTVTPPRSVGINSYSKPRASPTSYSPGTSRIGRSWETDQCWC